MLDVPGMLNNLNNLFPEHAMAVHILHLLSETLIFHLKET